MQAGDTLKSIARRFRTSRWILADLNDLDDLGLIHAGQRLFIPRPGASPLVPPRAQAWPDEVEPGPCVMLVRTGDTLDAIAHRFGVTAAAILEANHLQDPDLIQPGRPLLIPGPAVQPETLILAPAPEPTSEEPSPESEPATLPAPPPALPTAAPHSEELSGQYEYVVQPGDTLMAIARHFNVTVRALIEASHIADVNLVQPGQRLVVPGVSSPPGRQPADGEESLAKNY